MSINMDKAVMISIQPKWCELIASNKKTIEVRKTKPKLETPFKCYMYCTKGADLWLAGIKGKRPAQKLNGKVIGEFVCDFVISYEMEGYDKTLNLYQGITRYVGDYVTTEASNDRSPEENYESYLLKESRLSIDEIGEYVCGKKEFGFHTFYGWHISNLIIYDKPKELSDFGLKRPPQSWCYTEGIEKGNKKKDIHKEYDDR